MCCICGLIIDFQTFNYYNITISIYVEILLRGDLENSGEEVHYIKYQLTSLLTSMQWSAEKLKKRHA